MGRQIVLPYSEIRIAEAFKYPSRLTEADIQELVKRMAKDASLRQKNMRRTMNIGEVLDTTQIERGRKSAERHRRKAKWHSRELSDAEKRQLQSAWGN